MAWIKLDDRFARHPKVVRACVLNPLAGWAMVKLLCYCAEWRLDDGIMSAANAADIAGSNELGALFAAGLVDQLEDGRVAIHDYTDYQSADGGRARRRAAAARAKGAIHANHSRGRHDGKPDPRCELCFNASDTPASVQRGGQRAFSELAQLAETPASGSLGSLKPRYPSPSPSPLSVVEEEDQSKVLTREALPDDEEGSATEGGDGGQPAEFEDVVRHLVDSRIHRYREGRKSPTPAAAARYRTKVLQSVLEQHADEIRRMIRTYPNQPALAIAAGIDPSVRIASITSHLFRSPE